MNDKLVFSVNKEDLRIAYIICLFFTVTFFSNAVSRILDWNFLSMPTDSISVWFYRLAIFLICSFSAFEYNGTPLKLFNSGLRWDREESVNRDFKRSFIFLVLALIFNPIYYSELPPILSILLYLSLIGVLSSELYTWHKRAEKSREFEVNLKALFDTMELNKIDDFFRAEGHQLKFEELIKLTIKYKSKAYVDKNRDDLIANWEYYVDWNKFESMGKYYQYCNSVIDKNLIEA